MYKCSAWHTITSYRLPIVAFCSTASVCERTEMMIVIMKLTTPLIWYLCKGWLELFACERSLDPSALFNVLDIFGVHVLHCF